MTILQAESATAICQRALGLAEHRNTFDSLEDGTTLARECRLRYDIRRRSVLEALDWNFARHRAVTAIVTTATPPPDLPIALALPPEPLRIRAVLTGRRAQRFVREAYVFTQTADAAQLVYTREQSNAALFPPVFTAALEYLLASEFAMVYSRSANRSQIMLKSFRDTMEEANALEGQERSDDLAYESGPWVDAIETPWLGVSGQW